MQLGFIGLGTIGSVMASRLASLGNELMVYDIVPDAADRLAKQGGTVARSLREVADACETIFLSLPSPAVVRQVALGEDALADGSAVRHIVDLSTTGASASSAIAAELSRRDIAFLDAPVSGGVAGAANGTLSIMTSGPQALYQTVEPILKQIGGKIFYLGDRAGQAQTMKVINNLMAAASIITCCEGLAFGAKAGLDARTMLEVLNASSGRSYATEQRVPRGLARRGFPMSFSVQLMHKDIRLCLAEAEKFGMPMWMGPAVRQFLAFAMSQGAASRDLVELIKNYEALSGVEVAALESGAA